MKKYRLPFMGMSLFIFIFLMSISCSNQDNAKQESIYRISIDFDNGEGNVIWGFHGMNQNGEITSALTCNDLSAAKQLNPEKSFMLIGDIKIDLVFDVMEDFQISDVMVINGKEIPAYKVYRLWFTPFAQDISKKLMDAENVSVIYEVNEQQYEYDFNEFDLQKIHELSFGSELPRSRAFLFDDFTKKITQQILLSCLTITSKGLPSSLNNISSEIGPAESDGTGRGSYKGRLTTVIFETTEYVDFELELFFDSDKWIIDGYEGSSFYQTYEIRDSRPIEKSTFTGALILLNKRLGPFPALENIAND